MLLHEKLIARGTNPDSLSDFINEYSEKLHDFFLLQKHSELAKYSNKIRDYILLNSRNINKLDYSTDESVSFLILLLDFSERFAYRTAFFEIHKIANKQKIDIPLRYQAAALYLIDIHNIGDYNNQLEKILSKLSDAFETEEDSVERVVLLLGNLYAQVVTDFGQFNSNGVIDLKNKIVSYRDRKEYFFINDNCLNDIFEIHLDDIDKNFSKIQQYLDVFANRNRLSNDFILDDFLIEKDSLYYAKLSLCSADFFNIREVSVELYNQINDDSLYHRLGRGTLIYKDQNLLLSYLYSYGKMHYHKIYSAIEECFNESILNKKFDIIDWGCGQGIATITLHDFCKKNDIQFETGKITLIEPSVIALKRAALHVIKYDSLANIKTINKDLDSLLDTDLNNSSNTKIHLFSNILDIDLFSLEKLYQRIANNFSGKNYFICVSPFINISKSNRLSRFMNMFADKKDFNIIKVDDKRKGEWKGSWTRVMRVFEVTI